MKSNHQIFEYLAGPPNRLLRVGIGLLALLPAALLCYGAETPEVNGASSAAVSAVTNAFVVFGNVTDANGHPIPAARIVAHCGQGTLFQTGTAETDAKGNYRLAFGPGMLMGRGSGVGPFGVGFQVATISARKQGYFIEGLGRAGNLAMTDSTNPAPAWVTNFSGLVLAFRPYRLDFKLLPACSIGGQLDDPSHQLSQKISLCLKGEKLPPSSSVLACADITDGGTFRFENVPVGYPWWFEATWQEQGAWKTVRSRPIVPSSSAQITLKITTAPGHLEIQD